MSIMDTAIAAAAALVGAFGGAWLGFLGARRISSSDRAEARRVQRQEIFASYLGALYPVVAELREMPANPKGWRTFVSETIDSLQGEAASYVSARRALEGIGNQHVIRADRLAAAVAQVQVLGMPDEVVAAFDAANEYVESLGEERTDELKARWPALHERLQSAARLLDAT